MKSEVVLLMHYSTFSLWIHLSSFGMFSYPTLSVLKERMKTPLKLKMTVQAHIEEELVTVFSFDFKLPTVYITILPLPIIEAFCLISNNYFKF